MEIRRQNRLRDDSILWFIVDALKREIAVRTLTKNEQRDFIRNRLAQEHRVDVLEIASGRNKTLYSALTRIYYLANPKTPRAKAGLAEARRRGLHFHGCYAIAIGKKTITEADDAMAR